MATEAEKSTRQKNQRQLINCLYIGLFSTNFISNLESKTEFEVPNAGKIQTQEKGADFRKLADVGK